MGVNGLECVAVMGRRTKRLETTGLMRR